jgi:hypothetical protein
MGVYLVIISDHPSICPRSHPAHFCALYERPPGPHFNGRFYAMMPIEAAIIELLRSSGPCCLDDVVTYLPNFSWGEVFGAVDRMSRDGRVLLRQLGYSTYQIALHSQFL